MHVHDVSKLISYIVLFINNWILLWSRVGDTSKRFYGPLKGSLDTAGSHEVR